MESEQIESHDWIFFQWYYIDLEYKLSYKFIKKDLDNYEDVLILQKKLSYLKYFLLFYSCSTILITINKKIKPLYKL